MPSVLTIEVDDSQLTAEDHAFIRQWAKARGALFSNFPQIQTGEENEK